MYYYFATSIRFIALHKSEKVSLEIQVANYGVMFGLRTCVEKDHSPFVSVHRLLTLRLIDLGKHPNTTTKKQLWISVQCSYKEFLLNCAIYDYFL